MAHFDVFNGDADGICSLHQLRLAHPMDARLVTGPKRDIALLSRTEAKRGDSITVLDLSLDANRDTLIKMLDCGVRIDYFDHHVADPIPDKPNLHALIDVSPDVCTSTLVDRHLQGRYRIWAAVGAFGDNLGTVARRLASSLGLQPGRIAELQALGENLNYNSYGDAEPDLLVHPAELYAILHRYLDPFLFMESETIVNMLAEGRRRDMELARLSQPAYRLDCGSVYILPDVAWSRRVRGSFANRLAARSPKMAFAVLTPGERNGYTVSVRAPLRSFQNAQQLCRQFPTGGGRVSAAGINHLPQERVTDFLHAFELAFGISTTRPN